MGLSGREVDLSSPTVHDMGLCLSVVKSTWKDSPGVVMGDWLRVRLGETAAERRIAVVAIIAVCVGLASLLAGLAHVVFMAAWVVAAISVVSWRTLVFLRDRRGGRKR